MKKALVLFLIVGATIPSIFVPSVEARPRCKDNGKVTVCKMPRPRKCTRRRPCIPNGYYRPILRPMPLR